MAKSIKPLNDTQIKSLKPQAKEYLKADGYNLYLMVTPTNSKIWRFIYSHPTTKKRIKKTLGHYPFLSLLKAREQAREFNSLLTAKLAEHFHFNGDHSTKWNVTSLTGWQNGAYLLPSGEILGEPTKPIYFTDKSGSAQGYTVSGTLESWQKEIANNVRNNYSMMLGIP